MNRFALVVLCTAAVGCAAAADSTCERISLNDNWRFTKRDPAADSTGLLYDVRPVVRNEKDDTAADAEPTEAEKIAAPSVA